MTRTKKPTYTLAHVYEFMIHRHYAAPHNTTQPEQRDNQPMPSHIHIHTYIHTYTGIHTHIPLLAPPDNLHEVLLRAGGTRCPGAGGRTNKVSQHARVGSDWIDWRRVRVPLSSVRCFSSTHSAPLRSSPESHNTDFPLAIYPQCPLPTTLQDQKSKPRYTPSTYM